MVYSKFTRQKLTTRSSTEADLVAIDDCMPQILWTRLFLHAQGYAAKESVIYQDNMSTKVLVENRKRSSSKRTRHLDIRYNFVMDKIRKREVEVRYCPTEEMVGEYFTKPLQRRKFRLFRDRILNLSRFFLLLRRS